MLCTRSGQDPNVKIKYALYIERHKTFLLYFYSTFCESETVFYNKVENMYEYTSDFS